MCCLHFEQYVCRFLHAGVVDAGFIAHPSFVTVEELKGITSPLAIAAAGKSSSST